jgi:hypothetical protein
MLVILLVVNNTNYHEKNIFNFFKKRMIFFNIMFIIVAVEFIWNNITHYGHNIN